MKKKVFTDTWREESKRPGLPLGNAAEEAPQEGTLMNRDLHLLGRKGGG